MEKTNSKLTFLYFSASALKVDLPNIKVRKYTFLIQNRVKLRFLDVNVKGRVSSMNQLYMKLGLEGGQKIVSFLSC